MAKGTINVVIAGNSELLNKELRAVERRLKRFGNGLKSIGDSIFRSVGVPFIAAGAAGVKAASDFESSLSKIKGLVGIAGDDLKQLENAALRLGPQMGKSATEAAEALFFITSAGLKGKDAIDVLEMSLKASAAGLGEVSTIADLATSVMNAYGAENVSAANATDTLTAAVREGKLQADTLAGAVSAVLPIASAMGVQFNEVGAAFAAMSRTGTSADEAATQLKGILSSLLKPTVEAEKALSEMGLSSEMLREQIKEEGLLSVLELLNNRFDGNTAATAKVFGNVRALTGVLDLMGKNADGTRQIFERMNAVAGDTDKAFGAAAETTEFKFKQSLALLNKAAIDLGRILIPTVTKIVNAIQHLIQGFIGMDRSTKENIVNVLKWTTALGAGLSIVGRLINGLAFLSKTARTLGLTTVFANAVKSLRNFGSTLSKVTKLFSPQGLILAGMIAVTVAIVKNWDKAKVAIVKAVNYVIEMYNNSMLVRLVFQTLVVIVKNLITSLKTAWGILKNLGSGLWAIIEGIVTFDYSRIEEGIADAIKGVAKTMKDHGEKIADNFAEGLEKIKEDELDFITVEDVDNAVAKAGDMINGIKGYYNEAVGFISGLFNQGAVGFEKVEETVDKTIKKLQKLTPNMERPIEEFIPVIKNNNKEEPSLGQTISFSFQGDEKAIDLLNNKMEQFGERYQAIMGSLSDTVGSFFDYKNQRLENSYQKELQMLRMSTKNDEAFAAAKARLDEKYDAKRRRVQRQQAIANKAMGIADIIVKTAQAVVGALTMVPFTPFNLVLAKIVGGLGAVQLGLAAAAPIPALAQGGMTTGPGMAMIGDNASGKEFVIPFERMGEFARQAMGGNNVNVAGEFRVKGSDLILVLERANRITSAKRGYGLNA